MLDDFVCPVCKRDVSEFDKVYQVYFTHPHAYTDCMRQTFICTCCIGEFGETPEKFIEFTKELY